MTTPANTVLTKKTLPKPKRAPVCVGASGTNRNRHDFSDGDICNRCDMLRARG